MTLEHRFVLAEPEGGRLGPSPATPAKLDGRVSELLADMLARSAESAAVAETALKTARKS